MKNLFGCFLFTCLLIMCSCGDDRVDVPECIDQLAATLPVCQNADADLTVWNFNGRDVYCFFYGNCTEDNKAVIYNEDCEELCTLFGFSGNTECEGIDWDSNATNRRLVYEF